jgi:hypothetical protein
MASHYHLSRAARVLFAINVALPAILLVMSLFDGHSWWRLTISAAFLAACVANSYLLYLATSGPLITLTSTSLVVRSCWARVAQCISLHDVTGIAWSNRDTVCLRLRSGELHPVDLRGLGRADRDTVRTELDSWLRAASNIA